MTRLRKFLKLPARDRRLFLEALFLLARMRLTLSTAGYRSAEAAISPPRAPTGVGPGRIAWAIRSMAPLVPGATCLTQALAAQELMARNGKASTIRIGVAQDETGQFSAHAWLMYGDQVVVGGADHDLGRYTSIADLAPGSS